MKEQRAVTPRDRLKNVDIPVLFLYKVLQANKIIWKTKKVIGPIYPNLKKHVTENTHIFLFGLSWVSVISFFKWMNEWMNDWMNEWKNEWMNEWIN